MVMDDSRVRCTIWSQTRTLRRREINVVITHQDEERVDVLVPLLEDVFDGRIFYHRGRHIILAPAIPDLKCVLESGVRRAVRLGIVTQESLSATLAWYVPAGATGCTISCRLSYLQNRLCTSRLCVSFACKTTRLRVRPVQIA